MRHFIRNLSPFVIGGLIGLYYAFGSTKRGNWPNATNVILEMAPITMRFTFLGILLLGAGVGGTVARIIWRFADGGLGGSTYAWQKERFTTWLMLAGLLILFITTQVLG